MTVLDVRMASAPPSTAGGARGLIGWVCTSNPFYVLSALLVCLGLWVSFGSQAVAAQTWALLSGMAGYTLLLAVTACLLVRFVGVWDDVRTVLLLVVLMFLATSVTFDEVLARSPERGVVCYLAGFAFAVAVSEGMLWGIRLELPALFRAPYYLILALFFLYPVAITPLLDRPRSEALAWSLFGFSTAAGLAFLTLLPAARRGREYVRDNGSPWRWAWYPWTLFGVLAFGVGGRAAFLCWSMHHLPLGGPEPYIFGPYFLAPFGLAVGAVLLEIGLVERQKGVLRVALSVPAILVVLAMVGHRPEPVYQWFLGRFMDRLGGSPLYLTLLASAGFYLYAAMRGVPAAFDAMTAALGALAFVAPQTLDVDGLVPPRALPILAVGVAQVLPGLLRRESWRCLVGAGCVVAASMIAMRPTGAGSHQGPVAFHLALAAVLAIGATFDDRFGRALRIVGAGMGLLAALAALSGRIPSTAAVPPWAIEAYPPAMSLLIAGYGLGLGHRASLASAGLILAAWLAVLGWRGYCALRQVAPGLDYIAVGMVLFSMAVLTSLAKGGVLPWRVAGRTDKVPSESGLADGALPDPEARP
jgi:hypothetical protein